jgi:hypothetical protein
MNIDTKETLNPLEPPHFDAVSTLTVINDTHLVSGSRDKSVKIWKDNELKASTYISSDWVNLAVQSSLSKRDFYVASKDGLVKACKFQDNKISIMGSIQSGPLSVNGMVEL